MEINKKVVYQREKLEKAAYLLKAVAHPVRLAVIGFLEHTEAMTVNELSEAISCEQSLLSHHLITMKLRGILSSRKSGLHVYYSLHEREVTKLLSCIENCECML